MIRNTGFKGPGMVRAWRLVKGLFGMYLSPLPIRQGHLNGYTIGGMLCAVGLLIKAIKANFDPCEKDNEHFVITNFGLSIRLGCVQIINRGKDERFHNTKGKFRAGSSTAGSLLFYRFFFNW